MEDYTRRCALEDQSLQEVRLNAWRDIHWEGIAASFRTAGLK